MKKILKRLLGLILTFIVAFNPILSVWASNNNDKNKQIVSSGGTTSGDKVEISKTIASSELENYFDITLKVRTQEEAKEQDVSIVIVMDISNTMNENVNSSKSISRYDAAISAMEVFITKFAAASSKTANNNNIKRQIGFVAFNTDAHEIFSLRDCKTEEQATALIKLMEEETKNIISAEGYSDMHTRFTNIEAGLKMGRDLLSSAKDNKHIIFLSDGFPTTYIKNDYQGYDPYTTYVPLKNDSQEGYFFDGKKSGINKTKVCAWGTSYSDEAAIRARKMAGNLKNNHNITIHSVGVGLLTKSEGGTLKTLADYRDQSNKSDFSVIDVKKGTKNYEIGGLDDLSGYKKWLKTKIGSNIYHDATSSDAVFEAFTDIYNSIKLLSEAWETVDPMGDNIDFIGFYNNVNDKTNLLNKLNYSGNNAVNNNTATFTDNRINWNLKNSNYVKTEIVNGITYYEYEIKYRVRLTNESNGFKESTTLDTNKTTTLTYVVKKGNKITGKTLNYKIPQVKGFLGSLKFNKKSSYQNSILQGTTFVLVHDKDCACHGELKHMNDDFSLEATSTSNSDYNVIFNNIPSGHTYKLKEVKTDDYHIINETIYNVTVSYGETTHNIDNSTIINDINTKDLIIFKEVKNTTTDESFDFEINAMYKDEKLNRTYQAVRTTNGKDSNEEKITFVDGVAKFKLKHNESITIKNLPIKINFNIKELNIDGFNVKYQVNDGDIKKFNDKELENNTLENKMTIKFINSSGYVMPGTGSSGMLILAIIGTLLLLIPILYISVNILKKD